MPSSRAVVLLVFFLTAAAALTSSASAAGSESETAAAARPSSRGGGGGPGGGGGGVPWPLLQQRALTATQVGRRAHSETMRVVGLVGCRSYGRQCNSTARRRARPVARLNYAIAICRARGSRAERAPPFALPSRARKGSTSRRERCEPPSRTKTNNNKTRPFPTRRAARPVPSPGARGVRRRC